MTATTTRCPGCVVAMLPPGAQACPHCGLTLVGPTAAELWQVEQALAANDQQKRSLLARRDALLAALRAAASRPAHPAAAPLPAHPAAVPPRPQVSAGWAGPPPPVRRETSPQSVQNLLLALGGLLLAVAAIVFTVVAWGRFGLGGRAAILLTLTGIALATPVALMRRQLSATAETIAMVGLLLMALDGYAAYRFGALGLDEVNGFGYSAAVLAVIAATATGYARAVRLRLPTPVAIVVAQPVLPLIAAALNAHVTGFALAFALVAGLDVALIAAIRRRPALAPERVIAVVCAVLALTFAIPVALALTFFADNPWRAAGVLALTGAVIIGAATLSRPVGLRALFAGGGILLVATAAVGAALPDLGSAGSIAPALAGLVVALAALWAPKAWRLGGLGAGTVLLGAGGLAVLVPVGHALLGPFTWLFAPWTSEGGTARTTIIAASDANLVWSHSPAVLPAVALLAAGAAVVAYSVARRRGAAAAAAVGTVLATAVLPVALDLPRPAGLIVQGGVASVLCLTAALLKRPLLSSACGAAGLSIGVVVLAGCLADKTSTLVGLTVAIAVFAVAAVGARWAQVGAAAAGLLVLAATGAAAATVLAAGNDAAAASWAMLGVAAVAAACVHLAETRLPHHARAVAIAACVSSFAAAINAIAWLERPGLFLAIAGALVIAAALRRPRGGEREVFVGIGTVPLAGALLTIAESLLGAYIAPYRWLGTGWATAPQAARDAVGPAIAWSGDAWVLAVMAVIALAGTTAAAALWGRTVAVRVAVPAAALTLGVLPLACDLPWAVALLTLGAIACALLAAAALAPAESLLPPSVTGLTAAVLAGTMIAWSLAASPATVLTLTVTGTATLLAAIAARTPPVRLVCTVVSALAAILTAWAGGLAAGGPAHTTAFVVLTVSAGLAGLAAVLRREWRQESLCCEAVALAGAVLGVMLSAANPVTLSIALAVTGLVVGATALRPDRRAASYVGTALVILGSWVRLADLGITTPEAYTVPVGVAGLVIGWLRWRQRRHLSSWLVFAPGLASGLLPSLAALVLTSDDTSVANNMRPFVLGVAALVVVFVGGWQRLQAPLLLGGGVLAAVTLHELAPWVMDLVAEGPRWLPPALAGLLLLVVGATYEKRLSDVRRMRDAVMRMS